MTAGRSPESFFIDVGYRDPADADLHDEGRRSLWAIGGAVSGMVELEDQPGPDDLRAWALERER